MLTYVITICIRFCILIIKPIVPLNLKRYLFIKVFSLNMIIQLKTLQL